MARAGKKLPDKLIEQCKTEYITSEDGITLQILATKHGTTPQTLSGYSKRGNWVKEREEYWKNVQSEAIKNEFHSQIEEIKETNKKHFNAWESLLGELLYTLHQKTNKMRPSDFTHFSMSLERIQKGQRLSLGMDTSNTLQTALPQEAIEEFNKQLQSDEEKVAGLFKGDVNE